MIQKKKDILCLVQPMYKSNDIQLVKLYENIVFVSDYAIQSLCDDVRVSDGTSCLLALVHH